MKPQKQRGAYMSRFGAWGDMMYLLPTAEKLKRDYGYLHLDCGPQGAILFVNNRTFDRISVFQMGAVEKEIRPTIHAARYEAQEAVGWDKAVALQGTLEVECIAELWQEEFHWPVEKRRDKYGAKNFYDANLVKAGYEAGSLEDCGTFEFMDQELEWINEWRNRNGDRFIVSVIPCGSTGQKVPMGLEDVAREINASFSGTSFLILGDIESSNFGFGLKNVSVKAGKWNYRQSLAMIYMSDYVIGPETSLLVAAGMFGTPKTMICTSCSVSQATTYQRNDFSIQSQAWCSPCHRAIYNWDDKDNSENYCPKEDSGRVGQIPICNFYYDRTKILEGVEFGYKMRGLRNRLIDYGRKRVTTLPDMRSPAIQGLRWDKEIRQVISGEIRSIRENKAWGKDTKKQMEPGRQV